MQLNLRRLLPVISMIVLSISSHSQEKKMGAISGTVKDSRSKAPLSEAIVTLTSTMLKVQKMALTDSTGMYHISNLPAGIYSISFEMEGYHKFMQDSVVLQDGMSLGVSFQMAKERTPKRRITN